MLPGPPRRSKRGDWVLDYVLHDSRPTYIRRRLPSHVAALGQGRLDTDSEPQARFDSAYSHSKGDAVDHLEAVPPGYENVLVVRNKLKEAEMRRQRRDRVEEGIREQVRTLTVELRELAVGLSRAGVDPNPLFADVKRRIRDAYEDLRDPS